MISPLNLQSLMGRVAGAPFGRRRQVRLVSRLAGAACLLATSGCATSGELAALAFPAERISSPGCGRDVAPSDALSVAEWEEGAWEYVDWIGDQTRPTGAFHQVIAGPCAREVTGGTSFANLIEIASGSVFSFADPNRPKWNMSAAREFAPEPTGAPPPPLPGASFVRAALVGGASIGDGGQRDYVGLWSDRRGFVIASFSVLDGLGAGPARPMVRSRDPVRGLVYFPALHSYAGHVDFVQFGADGIVRLIVFRWEHDASVPCLQPDQLVTRVADGVPGPRRSNRRCG